RPPEARPPGRSLLAVHHLLRRPRGLRAVGRHLPPGQCLGDPGLRRRLPGSRRAGAGGSASAESRLIDRSRPPRPGELRPFRFPPFLHHRLANGLEVYAARLGDVPLISLELVAPAGGEHDPPGQSGLATLTAALLDEGTVRRSAMDIARDVERLGGYLTTGADWDVGYLA